MNPLQINGVDIAAMPNELSITIQDLDYNNSGEFGRAINGQLSRNRIAKKRTIELTYNALDWTTMSALLTSITDEFFTVYYPDPESGTYETRTFYVSDRPAGIIKTPLNTGGNITWGASTFRFIEQ